MSANSLGLTMGRQFAHHVRWSNEEVAVLNELYTRGGMDEICAMLPGRSASQIQNKAYLMGMRREKRTPKTPDQIRESKRLAMAKKRAENPESMNAIGMACYYRNHDENMAKARKYYAKRFFWGRAMKLRGENRASALDLATVWKDQRGRCALTGRTLGREAHLDHIVPRALGGDDRVENLRWLCADANYAKRAMSDDDFFALCREVLERR